MTRSQSPAKTTYTLLIAFPEGDREEAVVTARRHAGIAEILSVGRNLLEMEFDAGAEIIAIRDEHYGEIIWNKGDE